jgi:hypothetical protein
MTSWLAAADHVLRPARPALASCCEAADRHARARRPITEARAQAVADCVSRIEAARADIFAAKDGVVTARMTELEAEWRRLARRADHDGDAMELWARIAPRAWRDQKKWRVGEPERYADAAIALASDPLGVGAAEAAIDALRRACSAFSLPRRTRWCFDDGTDFDVRTLFEAPLRSATERLASQDGGHFALARAEQQKTRVYEAARERLRERHALAGAIAHAAFVDAVWTAAMRSPSPALPLRALWSSGYTIAWIDDRVVTLAIPHSAKF